MSARNAPIALGVLIAPQCPDCPPAFLDEDLDGERDETDRCLGTVAGVDVDSAGCSLEQYCGTFTPSRLGLATACRRADWLNDEPAAFRPKDCIVDFAGTPHRRVDDTCVPRVNQ